MEPSFKKLIGVDNNTKLIVFGYMRQCEKCLDSTYCNVIPSLVIYICIWYYHTESFGACTPSISVNRSGNTAICTVASRGTVFGKYCVEMKEQMIYRWRIRILGTLSSSMDIGICSTNNPESICANFSCGQSNYGSYSSGGRKNNYTNTFFGYLYGKGYNGNDTIQMELNTKQQTLSFFKNYSYQGIAFEHIPMKHKYYLAVSLGGNQDTVKLVDFCRINMNENEISQTMFVRERDRKQMERNLYKVLKYKYPRYAKRIVWEILKETAEPDIKWMMSQKDVLFRVAAVYRKQFRKRKSRRYR